MLMASKQPVPEIKFKDEVNDEPLEYGNVDIPSGYTLADKGSFFLKFGSLSTLQ